jgi:hypothetical protein
MASHSEDMERVVNSPSPGTNVAVEKLLAGIEDPQLDARYPNRAHLIAADNPHFGQMTTRALFHGDPVVLIYPDGREIVFTPERAGGVVALFLLLAAAWMWLRSRKAGQADVIQLPPRTRIELRDSAGLPLAA